MQLIADSGSTRTSWRLISRNNEIYQFSTDGLNPYFTPLEKVREVVQSQLLSQFNQINASEIRNIFFYGAGCSSPEKREVIYDALTAIFSNAKIEIATDLLGAARGTCGHQPGIAAILGTGSNSCEYDGVNIIKSQSSLGYILGDEGSGAHLGKKLLKAFFYNQSPENISVALNRKTGDLREVLDSIYNKPFPNRYIASYARFLQHHINDPWCANLVYDSFSEFLDAHILKYNTRERVLHIAGSVGFYFGKILAKAAADRNINTGSIVESPIAGLVLYHLGEI